MSWLLLLLGTALVRAEGVEPETALTRSLTEWTATVCGAKSVQVLWLGMDDPWAADPTVIFRWEGQPCRERPTLQLTVLKEGQVLSVRSVRPGLEIRVIAPVASRTAQPGERVLTTPGEILLQERLGESVGEGEWRAKVNIAEGQPVTTALVEPMPDALAGAPVTLAVRRGSLTISAPGRLLEDGYLGRSVRVVNDATHVALNGVLSGPGTVEIP